MTCQNCNFNTCIRCHIVSTASSKTGITGALQHHALSIFCENNGCKCSQLCKSLGQAQCCLSVLKDGKNKEQYIFEEIAKGKYERTNCVCLILLRFSITCADSKIKRSIDKCVFRCRQSNVRWVFPAYDYCRTLFVV